MSTSGTRAFILTRDQIITDALSKINAIGLGDTPSSNMLTESERVLNMMVQHWQNYNIFIWMVEDTTLTLEAAIATYYPDDSAIEVKNFFFRDADGNDTTLKSIDRIGYAEITDKDEPGEPTKVFVDYDLNGPVVKLWPVYAGTDGTLGITKVLKAQGFSAPADNPDFPTRWYKALCLNLAVDLCPNWGKVDAAVYSNLVNQAEKARHEARYGQNESSNIRFTIRVR
jgi:hypothetical protein